ncbi:MAG: response regulator transcription factor, partial [Chloroflexota bacterium]
MASDRVEVRRVVAGSLREAGYAVIDVAPAEEVGAAIEATRPALLIIGRSTAGQDSLRLLDQWRALQPGLRVMILSRSADALEGARALDAGADDHLLETTHPDELLARVRAILRRRPRDARPTLELGRLSIDLERQGLYRDGELVRLSRTEWLVLER